MVREADYGLRGAVCGTGADTWARSHGPLVPLGLVIADAAAGET